jgi:transposase InsO family protein
VLEMRRLCLLPLDDLLCITQRFINPAASRSGVSRLLRREGMAKLAELMPKEERQDKPGKTFKDYVPGFVHVDIKYLPQMPDEASRRYLFVAIDRATRWVFMRTYKDQTEASSVDFLRRVGKAACFKITKLLTDNGSQFTDRFTSQVKEPSGKHAFDVQCKAQGIEHRLAPPRHPQTNGMVERFNGRISEVIKQTRFASAAELESTLMNYQNTYNHHIPQRALGHLSPIEALQSWRKKAPDLFVKQVYKHTELDTYSPACGSTSPLRHLQQSFLRSPSSDKCAHA